MTMTIVIDLHLILDIDLQQMLDIDLHLMVNIITNNIITKCIIIFKHYEFQFTKKLNIYFLFLLCSSYTLTNSLYSSLFVLLSFIDLVYSLLKLSLNCLLQKYIFVNTS